MKNVWVVGSNGQVGRSLQDEVNLKASQAVAFNFLTRKDFDLRCPDAMNDFFFGKKIDYIVNCAAYTAVDKAEEEEEQAFLVNSDAVKNLATICKTNQATFLHISTDYVFDGTAQKPYLPSDEPNPINVYGKSKLEGEKQALTTNPKTIIVRTSWVYSDYGNNFYKTMFRLMSEGREIRVVNDQIGKPTHARDLAAYIYGLIISEDTEYGIHHFTGNKQMSWYEFALKIAKENRFDIHIVPISSEEYPTLAKRPNWSVLGNSAHDKK